MWVLGRASVDRPKIWSPGVREAAEVVLKAGVCVLDHSKQDAPQGASHYR